jgi:hypothetical protein
MYLEKPKRIIIWDGGNKNGFIHQNSWDDTMMAHSILGEVIPQTKYPINKHAENAKKMNKKTRAMMVKYLQI